MPAQRDAALASAKEMAATKGVPTDARERRQSLLREQLSSQRRAAAAAKAKAEATAAAEAAEAAEAVELSEQESTCSCKGNAAGCSLTPLLTQGFLAPGDNVLSVCTGRKQLFFAGVTDAGMLRVASGGGAQLTLAAPCVWLRIISRRTGAKNLEANPLRKISYKGVPLETVAAAAGAKRRSVRGA